MAFEWAEPSTMTVQVSVNTNSDGNIAMSGETAAGAKTLSIPGIAKDATFTQTKTVFEALIGGIAKGTYVESSASRIIKSGVVEG